MASARLRRQGGGHAGSTHPAGRRLRSTPELPDDETLKPVTEAIRALLGVFGTGQRLAANGQRA